MHLKTWLLILSCFFLSACEEEDDNVRCLSSSDCSEGAVCYYKYCKFMGGIPCVRPSQCASARCTAGFCEPIDIVE